MSINYAKRLAADVNGNILDHWPAPKKANAVYTNENATVSSVISLSHDTTQIEITTVGAPAFIRWISASDGAGSVIGLAGSTANYDHACESANTRQFIVPIESGGLNAIGSVVGVNRQAGLYQRVAIKTAGIGSVMLAEY